MMKHFFLFLILSVTGLAATGQQVIISGAVYAAGSGAPLAGATVRAKVGKEAASTDSLGNFTLAAAPPVTLTISYAGYHPATMVWKEDRALRIILTEASNSLQNVTVSTGYQRLQAGRSTGSFAQVDSSLIVRSPATNILERLDGITPSLLFDRRAGAAKLSVRGRSTIYASDEPLIVVDNFPYEGDIASINPADVESITVLRDAAAASIWGVRAANGVIVITTRRGRWGAPLRVSVTSNITTGGKPGLMDLPVISPGGFIDAETFLFSKNFYRSQERNPAQPVLSPVVEILIQQRDGVITADEAAAQLAALRTYDVREDFERYVYRPSLNQQYSLSLTGGSANSTQALTVGWDKARDVLSASFKRLSLRYNTTWRVGSRLEIYSGIAYTASQSATGKKGYGTVMSSGTKLLYPYAQLADDAGTPLPVARDYRSSFAGSAEASGLLPWQYFPLTDDENTDNATRLQDLVLQTGATLRLFPGLSAEARYQYQGGNTDSRDLQGLGAYTTRDMINRYSAIDPSGAISYGVPVGDMLDQSFGRLQAHSIRGGFSFNGRTGSMGTLTAIAGAEYRQVKNSSAYNRTYGYNDQTLTHVPVNYDSLYNQYYFPALTLPLPYVNGFTGLLDRYVSYYANAAYTYKGRYTLSVSGRRDGSNLFGVATNQKFVPLWSVGGAWQLNGEPFFNRSGLPQVKLRASWGYNGNVDNTLSAFTTLGIYSGGNNVFINAPFAIITRVPDPSLRWERVGTANVGLDLTTADGRLGGSLDVYRKGATDLIGDAPVDPTVGIPTAKLRRNIGAMVTKGFDLQASSVNLDGAFRWQTTLLFSYNRDKLTRYDSVSTRANAYTSGGSVIIPVVGKPVYNVFSYAWAGLDSVGDPQGYVDGKPSKDYAAIINGSSPADLVYHGPALPPFFGSLRNTFTWKGFELSTLITWRAGYFFRRPSVHYGNLYNSWRGHADFDRRWQQPGDEAKTDVPSMPYPINTRRDNFYTNASVLVERGDHIRLQDIRLAYTFRGQSAQGPFRQLQLWAYAGNLGILWRANGHGIDPDYSASLLPATSFSFGFKADL